MSTYPEKLPNASPIKNFNFNLDSSIIPSLPFSPIGPVGPVRFITKIIFSLLVKLYVLVIEETPKAS